MKSREQRQYESRLKRDAMLAHPLSPVDGQEGLWQAECARPGCEQLFVTATRQRRYCSEACRRLVAEDVERRVQIAGRLITVECAATGCSVRFTPNPKRPGRRYCTPACQKREWKRGVDLGARSCAWCGRKFDEARTRRAKYCTPRCRVAAARERKTTR